MILSAAMMLEWFASDAAKTAAKLIHRAVEFLMTESDDRTCDLGGTMGTAECGDRVAELLGYGRCAPACFHQSRRLTSGY